MIQKQKRQLFRLNLPLISFLIVLHIISLFYIFKKSFIFPVAIYVLALILFFFAYQKNKRERNLLEIKKQDLREKINLLQESIRKEKVLTPSLDKRNYRYTLLKQALDRFNQSLVLSDVGAAIAEETFILFGGSGNVLIYLINHENNNPEILFTKKLNLELIIKEKYGDLFNEWVIKHNQPLLIEDTSKDFRFDFQRIKEEVSRPIGSLIITPIITSDRFIGILRIESEEMNKFSSDDLRFLSTISNLAGIAIENSLLYGDAEELAIKDGLTGLYLRRFLDERGKEELQYAFKQNSEISVLMIDIDHFKKYNDNFGHRAGDIVLMHIADLLKGIFHDPVYTLSRFGGEEFLVLLPNTKKSKALKLAENLRKGIEEGVIILRRSPVKITVSIGVAAYPSDADSWVDLIKQSDTAMYKAKQEGRNRVCSLRSA
ncbi:MAG: sensor domain-containing diguanylate cyclase [Candidatus Omnitrophica bacterium]|nr:sensor domain-containing diguanylate cyclase [Candidatus Omnitrophota bacterium]